MNKVTTYLSIERICAKESLKSKKRVLEKLSQLLAPLGAKADLIFDELIRREKLGSTALGKGVAIPHIYLTDIEAPIIALLTLDEGIDFDSPDGLDVSIFVGVLIPEGAIELDKKILSELTGLVQNNKLRHALFEATTSKKLYGAMLMGEVLG